MNIFITERQHVIGLASYPLVLDNKQTQGRSIVLKAAAAWYCVCLQDFTLDMYFRQYWKDDRLAYGRQNGIEVLSVSTDYLRNMWVPDTFFCNEKTAYLHMVTTNNEFVRIKYDGGIYRSMRLVIV